MALRVWSFTFRATPIICIDQVFCRYEAVYIGCFTMFRLGDYLYHVDAGSEHYRQAPVTRRVIEP